MKKMLVFKTVAIDTLPLHAGQVIPAGEIEFYTENRDLDDDDVTEQGEEQILRWILSSCGRDLLLQELEVDPGSFVALSVGPPIIERGQSKPGDIHLLVCEDNCAHLAVGIQCKRVKVKALSQEDDQCNKLPDISGGIKQANRQRDKLGFHRNYLMIVIETYRRNRSNSSVFFVAQVEKRLRKSMTFHVEKVCTRTWESFCNCDSTNRQELRPDVRRRGLRRPARSTVGSDRTTDKPNPRIHG